MHIALQTARFHESLTNPNPSVGCVLVDQQGVILAREATAVGGRPHAEYLALERAGAKARKATLYVTLEPCRHDGKTPPCADKIIHSGVQRVVIAITDPDSRTNGRGIEHMRNHGILVKVGILSKEVSLFLLGYFSILYRKRPLVTWKVASSLDGSIATKKGESQWITHTHSRRFSHLLRAKHDAIMIGRKTCHADDPLLSCRLRGLERASPLRICLDSQLSLSMESQLVKTAKNIPLRVYGVASDETKKRKVQLEKKHVKVIFAPTSRKTRKMSLSYILENMSKECGIQSLLLEGGAQLAASFFNENLVDRIFWIHASLLLGASGKNAIGSLEEKMLNAYPRLSLKDHGVMHHKSHAKDRLGIYDTKTLTQLLEKITNV